MALLDGLGTLESPGPGILIETSGSSAVPKRVRLSAMALRASAEAVHARLGGPGQWLLALPTAYIAGANVVVRSHIAGTEPIEMPTGSFVAKAFADCVEQMGTSRRYTALVPVQLARLIEGAQYDGHVRSTVAQLDAIIVGGQASGDNLLSRARGLGWNVVESYGSTETCGGVVYDGVPLDGVHVRIESGEIWIAGPTLASGYENPDGTADVELTSTRFVERDGGRWYRTDDAGELQPSEVSFGLVLRVIGRRDRVIISGGIKVSLAAIEEVVRALPGVADVSAAAVSDEEWGQRPVLGVEVSVGNDVAEELVRETIEAKLGRVSVPDRIWFGSLPRTSSGKPDNRRLVALVAE